MCSETTSALALNKAKESPSLTSNLSGKKALAQPVESAITHLYFDERPPTLVTDKTLTIRLRPSSAGLISANLVQRMGFLSPLENYSLFSAYWRGLSSLGLLSYLYLLSSPPLRS
eukprot:TRINITY_DN1666_c0_g1_i4.p1 TRINITY_DN1666_c0_g1~~TRINITY_DN1666_c0_g1_i4.p1  ORF type:complete len:115 (+),score=6.45 TRINITY_DN1666_c0_g1_i4:128-472(+)